MMEEFIRTRADLDDPFDGAPGLSSYFWHKQRSEGTNAPWDISPEKLEAEISKAIKAVEEGLAVSKVKADSDGLSSFLIFKYELNQENGALREMVSEELDSRFHKSYVIRANMNDPSKQVLGFFIKPDGDAKRVALNAQIKEFMCA